MASLTPTLRSRSPRFPSHSVNEAIEFVSRIYAGVHRSQVDSLTALKLMGFAGKSGASAQALGSVRQFGLIEGVGDKTRVSELAMRILEPASNAERSEAIREAAKQPEVFKLVHDRFDGRIPSANEPMRAFLIRELGFSKNGAEDCLKSLRQTIEQSELERPGNFEPHSGLNTVPSAVSEDSLFSPSSINDDVTESNSSETMRIRLTRDCFAELKLVGTVSEKAITNLIRHIDLMKEVWAED